MNVRLFENDNLISKHIKRNCIIYIAILVVYTAGIIIGAIYYKNTNDESNVSLYLENTFSRISDTPNNATYEILQKSLEKNIMISLLFWILGASVIGLPFLFGFIVYKGFTIGFTISSFIMTLGIINGTIISLAGLFLQTAIVLLAILIDMVSSIKYAWNLLVKKEEMRVELSRHTLVSLMCFSFFIFASFVETFISNFLLKKLLERL